MAQHGGKRPGAGRKVGTATKTTSEAARIAAASGITPVEAMLQIMRTALAEGEVGIALEAARSVAPYVSPRLSAVAIDLKDLTDEQLRNFAA